MTEKVNYNDPNPIDTSKIYTPKELADFVRRKMFGKDVREAIALAIENIPEQVTDTVEYATKEQIEKDKIDLTNRINRIVLGTDQETLKLVVRQILKDEGVID